MELDALSISVGILAVPLGLIALFYLIAYIKNYDRYPIPKYLPREDEVIWAMAMSNPGRIWLLPKVKSMRCISWDLGMFTFDLSKEHIYEAPPMVSDIIVTPKKWGGYHALAVTQILSPDGNKQRFVATYIGEYKNETIKSTRTGSGNKIIS